MDVGAKIKEYRKIKKLTQTQLSEKANVSRSYLGDVENGRYNPSLDFVESIALALEIPMYFFFKDDGLNDINKLDPLLSELITNIKTLPADKIKAINDFVKAMK